MPDNHFKDPPPDGTPSNAFTDTIDPNGRFPPEAGRYYLYVSLACPFAHRALLVRNLKGLQDIIPLVVVHPKLDHDKGWSFPTHSPFPGATPDPLLNATYLSELYFKSKPDYEGRYTVPVLFDSKTHTIVNNESPLLLRILDSAFDSLLPPEKAQLRFSPHELRKEIDEFNSWSAPGLSNGVYRAGFSMSQESYDTNVPKVFETLDKLEKLIEGKEYFIGDRLTEADIRMYTTLIRFDVVYQFHFKCNMKSIRHDYPNLHLWLRCLYWNNPVFRETMDFDHSKHNYFASHKQINPTGIIPLGPRQPIEPL